MIPQSLLELPHAAIVHGSHGAGRLKNFTLAGRGYVFTPSFGCHCPIVEIVAYQNGREVDGNLTLAIVCARHGQTQTSAQPTTTDTCMVMTKASARATAIFAYAKRRHRNDRRVGWGNTR